MSFPVSKSALYFSRSKVLKRLTDRWDVADAHKPQGGYGRIQA